MPLESAYLKSSYILMQVLFDYGIQDFTELRPLYLTLLGCNLIQKQSMANSGDLNNIVAFESGNKKHAKLTLQKRNTR